ncbi:iron complex outermembrane receptor protein [Sphingomonas sp. SORGH_AS 950]|uniref:TonB-dependent receptor plug domain-containing protein n=1 Tax=Sphingomonas sp. SORGH_AS_0950 TaxID=3041792 RepID=UPI0027834FA4|nr:TonB-dependent receptor [Sphingomonas sp. SORGH_AS_0950]MDQ1158854.1 iron complex outermembrane receptor protein [Sphingomonas sp. SORGH_AS_0950]
MKLVTASAVVALNALLAPAVLAQSDPSQAKSAIGQPAPDVAGSDDVVVTGTRERGRTQFDTLAPVDVLPETLVRSSVSGDLNNALAQLLPSFNVQRLPAADGQAFVRPATLRGLSADQTLVLVNGKRYHRSALLGTRGAQAPDLASIPSLAIKRIEVLRDGASAQYGSDAIAGVINIILDDQPGMEAYGQFSQYYAGDGNNYQSGARGGIALDDKGAIVFTGQFEHGEATSRTRQRPDALAFQAANPTLSVPNPVQRWGQPDEERVRGAVDMHYDLADAVKVYAFGTVQQGEGLTDFNWRNPSNTGSVYNASSAFPGFSFRSLYPAGFTPRFGTQFADLQLVSGLRGNLSDALSYDLSASAGRSRIDYTIAQTLNASLGPASPTSFYLGRLTQRETNLNVDFVYRLPVGGVEPLNIAFGGERRIERYAVGTGDPASYAIGAGAATGLAPNSNGFPGFGPQQAGRFQQTSNAGYVDLAWHPVMMLTLGAAGRYEDFSSFGDKFTYKFSGRVEPVEWLALRGTYSTGFRAPTPAQLNTRVVSQGLDTRTLQVFNQGRLAPTDPLAVALGAKPLRPETSRNISAGLVAQTHIGLGATVDLYQIDVDDRFSQSATISIPAGFANPNRFTSISYFTNDFNTRTRGVDVVVSYARTLGDGRVSATLAYNYNRTTVRSGTSAAIANDTQRRIFQERLPQHNATGTLGYDIGRIGVMLRGRYYGPWTDVTGNATGELFQRFGGLALFDASLTYRVTPNISVRGGAENVFGTYPAEATNQANRGLIYSRNAPYDTDGGRYYVRLGLSF